ncbi:hypothetical protein [Bradyrhizobium paxllaeri]|uniref:hypothetical protein n=1 Tax=Bradyrhizobium paxllaeri TaxID=190148 RepID=UPI0008288218|nr:hypothetical protein [Bradyrhizobium paxllaeri]
MDFVAIGKTLSEVLPRLRGRIQLSGLIIIVVVGALVSFARPGDYLGLILVGGVGVGFIVFGQLFHFLKSFKDDSRPTVFLVSFLSFLLFIIALVALFVIHVRPSPSFFINQARADSSDDADKAGVFSKVSDIGDEIGKTISLPKITHADDVQYTFSERDGIATLTSAFSYSQRSRSDQYPDGDFHEGVNWGHPWMSFNLVNPTKAPIVYSLLQIDVVEMHAIKSVILDIDEIDGYVSGKKQNMVIHNRGWGAAKDAKLKLLVGSKDPTGGYSIIASKTYSIDKLDEVAVVDIADLVPAEAKWDQFSGQGMGCAANGYLTAIGRLDYIDDVGTRQHETFRSTIYQCFGGGGNIPWSGYFNVNLPDDPGKFPLTLSLSECIAPNSAGKLKIIYLAEKSAHYHLKFSLKDTNGSVLSRQAKLDILVPRPIPRAHRSRDKFVENPDVKGCT